MKMNVTTCYVDAYFSEYNLAFDVDEKRDTDKNLFLKRKDEKF